MQSRASVTLGKTAPRGTTATQKIGWIVFGFGALYMAAVGWLASWRVVPAIREGGIENLSEPAFFFIWTLSAPLGAILVAIGAALAARVAHRFVIGGSVVLVASLALSTMVISEVLPPLFGVGGGLITLFFLGALWDWARTRPALPGSEKAGTDLRMVGHTFFVIAAWYLCGLLGAPTYALRPELAQEVGIPEAAPGLATAIMVYLVLGWAFTYFGGRVALRDIRHDTP